MKKLVLSACLWDANSKVEDFSRCFTNKWALRLANMWSRHLTVPHRFILFTDKQRDLPHRIEQRVIHDLGQHGYGDCVQPFVIEDPMIFTGLDTLIIGNCDKLARHCLETDVMCLPRHPYEEWSINGVVMKPQGMTEIFTTWRGENDMKWMRSFPHRQIDDLWPNRVVSYKKARRDTWLFQKARIVYFHGTPKMHQLKRTLIVRDNWK